MHRISCSKSLHMFKLHFLQVFKMHQSISKQYYHSPSKLAAGRWFCGKLDFHSPTKTPGLCPSNHPPEAKPSHLTLETLLWLHEIHQSFQHWPFLKLEAFVKCIGKHPKAPTFNIDVDTNKKVEKMKKRWKSSEVWVSLERICTIFQRTSTMHSKRTPRFQPKKYLSHFRCLFPKDRLNGWYNASKFLHLWGSIGIFCKCESMGKLTKFEITSG